MWEGDVWVAVRAARAGAEIARSGFYESFGTVMKGDVDPVTEVDESAETAIRDVISTHFPDDAILGEERGGASWSDGRVWIIDPLDGTVNFVHHVPHFSVSVALWSEGKPLVGVIIDVLGSEEFVAAAGEGASVNGEPISVSGTTAVEDSLIVTGFPYDRRERAESYLQVVARVMETARGIRRLGSAALDLAWVACGRFDGYWEHGGIQGVKPWDAAAGLLLVIEAGGTATDSDGVVNRLDARAFVATNGKIHGELMQIVADNMPEHLR